MHRGAALCDRLCAVLLDLQDHRCDAAKAKAKLADLLVPVRNGDAIRDMLHAKIDDGDLAGALAFARKQRPDRWIVLVVLGAIALVLVGVGTLAVVTSRATERRMQEDLARYGEADAPEDGV